MKFPVTTTTELILLASQCTKEVNACLTSHAEFETEIKKSKAKSLNSFIKFLETKLSALLSEKVPMSAAGMPKDDQAKFISVVVSEYAATLAESNLKSFFNSEVCNG